MGWPVSHCCHLLGHRAGVTARLMQWSTPGTPVTPGPSLGRQAWGTVQGECGLPQIPPMLPAHLAAATERA